METVKHHKFVSALPGILEHDAIYYVRRSAGFDLYATNHLGFVVASKLNQEAPAPAWVMGPVVEDIGGLLPELVFEYNANGRLDVVMETL